MVGLESRTANCSRLPLRFDAFITMDQNIEFQQNLATLPIAVLVVEAPSNRMAHLKPLVPGILRELNQLQPKSLRKAGT